MPYRERLRRYVVGAAVISACVFALCILTGQPLLALLYAYPVALLGVLFGMRAGLAATALATVLTVLGGSLGGSSPGAAVYLCLCILLLLVGVATGRVRQTLREPAEADAEGSPSFAGLAKKILASLILLIDLAAALVGASVAAPAPAASWQPPMPVESHLVIEAETPSAQRSTLAALMDAFSGSLTSHRFQLADVEADRQAGYCEALRRLNALLAEPGPDRAEAREIAAGLEAVVVSGDVEAVAVVAALDACGDPLLGLRAVAYDLGTLSVPLREAAEEVEPFLEFAAEAAEAIERRQRQKKGARKAGKTGKTGRAPT
jgi:hypothetical protein